MCRYVVYNLPPLVGQKNSTYRRGDVIEIVEDGVFLGVDIERGYPAGQPAEPKWWLIIENPGVSVEDGHSGLLARDPGNARAPYFTDLGHRTHKRMRHFDLASSNLDIVKKPLMPRSGVIG